MMISIFGTNGMLSKFLTEKFVEDKQQVILYGLDPPQNYSCSKYIPTNLLKDKLNYSDLLKSDIIIYAAGAGVQGALRTDPSLMYALNVSVPINITLQLKKNKYKGIYMSFGSYMEIGANGEEKSFSEDEVVCSSSPMTNDYGLSKRLYGRYMRELNCEYRYWHFILPNMFSRNDFLPGTRLIPYILQYIQDYKKGINPEFPKFSAGTQKRQFILMDEISSVLDSAIEYKIPSGLYNIGGGEYYSIRTLIERIFSYYNVPCNEEFFGQETRRDDEVKSLLISGDKLKEAIHFLPGIKIEEVLIKHGQLR